MFFLEGWWWWGGGYFNAVDVFFYKFGLVLFPPQPHQILVALKEDIELNIEYSSVIQDA